MIIRVIIERSNYKDLLDMLPKWQRPYFSAMESLIDFNTLKAYFLSSYNELFEDNDSFQKLLSKFSEEDFRSFLLSSKTLEKFGSLKNLRLSILNNTLTHKELVQVKSAFDICEVIEENNIDAENHILGPNERFFELLDYQMYIKEQVLGFIDSNLLLAKGIVHMPTGTGKTKTTMHVIQQYFQDSLKKEGVVVWIAHTNVLLEQAINTFENVWMHLGEGDVNILRLYGGKYNNWDDIGSFSGIIFANISSLINLVKNTEKFEILNKRINLVIFDEAHKSIASETQKAISEIMRKREGFTNRNLIGLTATPGRSIYNFDENNRLSEYYDNRIFKIDPRIIEQFSKSKIQYANQDIQDKEIIRYFQDRKVLSRLRREEIEYEQDRDFEEKVTQLKPLTKDGDYRPEIISAFATNIKRNSAIISKLKDLAKNNISTLFFACSVEHGRFITAFLRAMNIKTSEVYGSTNNEMRNQQIRKFKNGENVILVNCSVLTTGFDATNIGCVFITKPTKSIVLYSQMIGRGLRGPKMGGKSECLLIDMKDNLQRFSSEDEAFSYFEEYWR